jgi:hypothetical protein
MFIYDDNFLTEEEIVSIENTFNSTYEWKYCNILHDDQSEGNIKYFTSDHNIGSPGYEATRFILNKMLAKHQIGEGIVNRVKFNITPVSDKPIVTSPHTDMNEPHMVFLYYVNDAYGDTLIYDGLDRVRSISPKRGAAILFDGKLHSWCTPDKGPMRQVINVNLIFS